MNLTKINTKKLAELVGILLGDGYLSSSTNRMKISFNSKNDKDYINYVERLLAELFDVKPILKQRVNENTAELYIFKRDVIGFLINNVGIRVSPKWNNATIPSKFLSSKLDLQVLRGYFDTDGCLVTTNNNNTIYPRLEMKISPSPMQKQFMDILKKYKFSFGVYQIGNGKVRIQLNGKTQLEKWIELVGFSNKKHRDKIKRFI